MRAKFITLLLIIFSINTNALNYKAIAIIESRCNPKAINGSQLGLFQIKFEYLRSYGINTTKYVFMNNTNIQFESMEIITNHNRNHILNNKDDYNYFSIEQNLVLAHCAGLTGAKRLNAKCKINPNHHSSAMLYLNTYLIISRII